MKRPLNPELEVGDTIVLYHMDGETSVSPGTIGVVRKISIDPFETESGGKIIDVQWENGSTLSLLTTTDAWKKIENKDNITESDSFGILPQNVDLLENFDWRWFRNYLKIVRDSGVINMYGAAPLLYSGREHIERYYGEGREDDEEFQNLLDVADESKHKFIVGVLKLMEKKGQDISNIDLVNSTARRCASNMLAIWINLSEITGRLT